MAIVKVARGQESKDQKQASSSARSQVQGEPEAGVCGDLGPEARSRNNWWKLKPFSFR